MSKTAGLDQITGINTILSGVAFHIEISNLICSANQITGFYMKCNTGLKWVNVSELTVSKVLQNICLDKFLQGSMKKNARGGIFITCQNQCFHYIKTVQLICRANLSELVNCFYSPWNHHKRTLFLTATTLFQTKVYLFIFIMKTSKQSVKSVHS